MKRSQLQDFSIFENKSCCMSEISSWLLKPISKKQSIQGESLFLQEASFLIICLNDECVDHNYYKGEDQNNDISHEKLDHSVFI